MPTPDRTSLEAIVTAGRYLLEAHGPSGLSMQSVADRVGVRAPSLYKRVRGRTALVSAVAEATTEDLAARLSATDGTLPALAHAYRAFAREWPEGFRLMFASVAPEDALHRVSAVILRATAEIVGEERALDAARLVTSWATGFLSMELAGAFRLGGDIDEAFAFGLDAIRRGLATG